MMTIADAKRVADLCRDREDFIKFRAQSVKNFSKLIAKIDEELRNFGIEPEPIEAEWAWRLGDQD